MQRNHILLSTVCACEVQIPHLLSGNNRVYSIKICQEGIEQVLF